MVTWAFTPFLILSFFPCSYRDKVNFSVHVIFLFLFYFPGSSYCFTPPLFTTYKQCQGIAEPETVICSTAAKTILLPWWQVRATWTARHLSPKAKQPTSSTLLLTQLETVSFPLHSCGLNNSECRPSIPNQGLLSLGSGGGMLSTQARESLRICLACRETP